MKNRIKTLRQEHGKTQEQLANEIGVKKLTISRWENAENVSLKQDKAQQLADIFGVSVSYLLGYEDNFVESVKDLSQKDGSDEAFLKAFRAYYELKMADGTENLLTLKGEDFLNRYREEILKSLIPNFNELNKHDIEEYLSDDKIINEAEQKLNDFLFTLGTLNPQEVQLLVNFIFLSEEDKQIVLNLLKSLSDK
ncbi:helix-turn-helix transcriptional regulator [Streptococcus oralis]|uniref:helix-turn-helix transcriptional regulator n=1 Tax=Streptococcus oralis TaxID=1303 RepID=UPI000F67F074|nr:helix-turn-helix transcriptional regulator [Streptococcus oralis]RSK15744.1 antitoxin HipB [Streptococcus oralis]